jgi:DNA-binding CsgD family transcriptional regulator
VLADALVEEGRLDEAEDAFAPLEAQLAAPAQPATAALLARGRLRLAQRRPREALADALAAGAVLDRMGTCCPGFQPWRQDAALARLALGEGDAARSLAAKEVSLARTFGAPRALGVALRAQGLAAARDRDGEALLREAAAVLEDADTPLDHARTLVDLGALLRRANRRAEARELLRAPLDVAHRAAAAPLADRAETELRATGAKPRRLMLSGADALTASERRIADLAAAGRTNREIAQELFVTARTVEAHLTNVFRKLDVGSRHELADALAPPAPAAR